MSANPFTLGAAGVPLEETAHRVAASIPTPPAGDTPHWFTPLRWFLAWERTLLHRGAIPRPFDLDPCGHPLAPVSQEIVRRGGNVYVGKDVAETWGADGLRETFAGRVAYVCPPFDAASMEAWMGRLNVAAAGEAEGIMSHIPAWTDRRWWAVHLEARRRSGEIGMDFVSGRVAFGWPALPEGHHRRPARFPSCVAVWRCRP